MFSQDSIPFQRPRAFPYQNDLYYKLAPAFHSQTPYGPHLPHLNGTSNPPTEEISTIFVVGFPDDMQEREFQNMFTFSQAFEAATLKIPNKEYTAYGGPAPSLRPFHSASNDPYNLVTVNQGGVVVDGGRDGTTASWPAIQDDRDPAHFPPTSTVPPRKQIIGFAKFRSRAEALEARDILQGRRVDIEKGAVLKAEMAKKNLHTKRGVGPVPPTPTTAIIPGESLPIPNGLGNGSIGVVPADSLSAREKELGTLGAMGFGVGGMSQWREQRVAEGGDEERERRREREAGVINAMGLGNGTRGPRERAEEDERERRRKETEGRLRSSNATAFDAFHSVPQASSMSRSNSNTTGGGLLSPSANVDNNNNHNGGNVSPMMGNGAVFMVQPQPDEAKANSAVLAGPWDMVMANGFRKHGAPLANPPPRPPSSNRQPSPPITNPSHSPTLNNMSPPLDSQQQQVHLQHQHQHHFQHPHSHSQLPLTSSSSQAPSSASSVADGDESQSSGGDAEMARVLGGLAVSTSQGSTSPQLPSPASGSSGGRTNAIDQNPPINTLYVGNLPTTQMPLGYPPNYLEETLRELFSRRPGFRKLCFRQKTNGPMCFVEFEDVNYAAKTLNELYGNTLNGLIKGGGIRLSYSKNPLGVRTPTSAGSGASLQQQQQQMQIQMQLQLQMGMGSGPLPFPADAFQPREMDGNRQQQQQQQQPIAPGLRSPPSHPPHPPSIAPSMSYSYMASQPAPRFFAPTPALASASASSAPVAPPGFSRSSIGTASQQHSFAQALPALNNLNLNHNNHNNSNGTGNHNGNNNHNNNNNGNSNSNNGNHNNHNHNNLNNHNNNIGSTFSPFGLATPPPPPLSLPPPHHSSIIPEHHQGGVDVSEPHPHAHFVPLMHNNNHYQHHHAPLSPTAMNVESGRG